MGQLQPKTFHRTPVLSVLWVRVGAAHRAKQANVQTADLSMIDAKTMPAMESAMGDDLF